MLSLSTYTIRFAKHFYKKQPPQRQILYRFQEDRYRIEVTTLDILYLLSCFCPPIFGMRSSSARVIHPISLFINKRWCLKARHLLLSNILLRLLTKSEWQRQSFTDLKNLIPHAAKEGSSLATWSSIWMYSISKQHSLFVNKGDYSLSSAATLHGLFGATCSPEFRPP